MPAIFRQKHMIQNGAVGILIIALTVGVVAIWDAQQPRVFVAESSVSIDNGVFRGEGSERIVGTTFTVQRMPMYLLLASSSEVLQPVIDDLNLELQVEDLSGIVTFTPGNGNLAIDISVKDLDPQRTAAVANAIAEQLAASIENAERASAIETDKIQVLVTETASVPTLPISPRTRTNLILSFFLGIILAISYLVIRERLDTKIRSEEDLEILSGVRNLGKFSYGADTNFLATLDLNSSESENFRSIRTNLQYVHPANPNEVLAVTSTTDRVGKDTAVIGIAIAFAQAGQKVVVVESDMRRPQMQSILDLEAKSGLSDLLTRKTLLQSTLVPWRNSLVTVLPAGPKPSNPSELLSRSDFVKLIDALRREFSIVIVNASPLDTFTDGVIASALADKVILVAGLGDSTRSEVLQAISKLSLINAGLVGTILSHATKTRKSQRL